MKNADVNEFIDHTTYEECAVLYNGVKYFFYGVIYNKEKHKYTYDIAIWNGNDFVEYVLDEEYKSVSDCLEKALNIPIFDGKTFLEVETDMEWIDW